MKKIKEAEIIKSKPRKPIEARIHKAWFKFWKGFERDERDTVMKWIHENT